MDRRRFLASVGRLAVAAPLAGVPRRTEARRGAGHPEPRPGIDGGNVLPSAQVMPHVAELFDEIRTLAHLADGIGCRCGCGAIDGMRSLLSCYEGVGMAQFCVICEGDGRLVARLGREGKTLRDIREAIDRRA